MSNFRFPALPGSLQCSSQKPLLNGSYLKNGATAGRFKYLAGVNDFGNRTKLACEYEKHGDHEFAYLLDGNVSL